MLFGRPQSVTAILRALRGVESDIDDTFTIILQYDGSQRDLVVTIKTNIVSPLRDQLKYFIRGTGGTFVKVSRIKRQSLVWRHHHKIGSNSNEGEIEKKHHVSIPQIPH